MSLFSRVFGPSWSSLCAVHPPLSLSTILPPAFPFTTHTSAYPPLLRISSSSYATHFNSTLQAYSLLCASPPQLHLLIFTPPLSLSRTEIKRFARYYYTEKQQISIPNYHTQKRYNLILSLQKRRERKIKGIKAPFPSLPPSLLLFIPSKTGTSAPYCHPFPHPPLPPSYFFVLAAAALSFACNSVGSLSKVKC